MDFSVIPACMALMLLLFATVADAVKVTPKLDFGDTSPGISPEDLKTYIEKEETSFNKGVVKAILEVKVGESVVTDKRPAKSDKKGNTDENTTKILLCNLKGDCKLHEIETTERDDDDDEKGGKKKLKPIIVTDFNEDPLEGNENDDDDDDDKNGKKHHKIPVIVGYKGAVKDDDFSYTGNNYGQGVDRLPAFYGMKLSPEFHQPYPGPTIYEEVSHSPPRPEFNYGSYQPTYPQYHVLRCVYPHYEEQRFPVSDIPDYTGSRTYYHDSFPGYGTRTPSPYGKFNPTRTPDNFHTVTPLGRRNGGSGWSGAGPNRPAVQWPVNGPQAGPNRPAVQWPVNGPPAGSNRPAVHWPVNRPPADLPTDPGVVSLHGKIDFDEDELTVGVNRPLNPETGNGNIKVDGKLGEPLENTDT